MNYKKVKNIFLAAFFVLYINAFAGSHFLSILVPCYNCAKTLEKTVESIYAQNITVVPFEVVCTDDCSTDNTLEILRQLEKEHDNFRVICHTTNQGGGAATNTCADNAQGDLFYRLDSDNLFGAPGTVDRMIKLLDETGCDIVMVQIQRNFNEKIIPGREDLVFKGTNSIYTLEDAIKDPANPATSGNYLFTRDSFLKAGGYLEGHGADTFCFGFKQLATGSKIAILPDSYYLHYINNEGYWSRGERAGINIPKMYQVFFDYQEVLDQKSRKILKQAQDGQVYFWELIHKKKLKLLSRDILQQLFDGYSLLIQNDYRSALTCLKSAYERGAYSARLKKLIEELEKNLI